MRKIPDIPSRKPNDRPSLRGVSKPDRSQVLRIAARDETSTVPGIGAFTGANAWNG
jgi:hypothetical protein